MPKQPIFRTGKFKIDEIASVKRSAYQNAEGCIKTSEDLIRYRKLIEQYKPDVIVETGTFNGQSALWFSQNANCPVWTIDINSVNAYKPDMKAKWATEANHEIRQLVGSSIDPSIVERVNFEIKHGGYKRPLIIFDSWHSSSHVHSEMESYFDLIPPLGYMVIEDGIIRWNAQELKHYGGSGPLDAIEKFLENHINWLVDEEIEGISSTTQHPKGWLIRKE